MKGAMNVSQKTMESRVRQQLQRYGYLLRKSRGPISPYNLGEYMVIKADTNAVVLGNRYDATLEDIIEWIE